MCPIVHTTDRKSKKATKKTRSKVQKDVSRRAQDAKGSKHPHESKKPKKPRKPAKPDRTDFRKQLYNQGAIGPIEQVSLPQELITKLRGVLIDVDPRQWRKSAVPSDARHNPTKFYRRVIRPMLQRHPVLRKAEVRNSGRGMHVIIRFQEPVLFANEAERQRWAGIVRAIQKLLPSDPDCPGITATTRALNSINSKNGAKVRRLFKGEPIPASEVEELFIQVRTSPFRTVARILFGADHITPCPICEGDRTRLDALDHVGICYGSCGKVRLGQIYDVFLKPRPGVKEE